MKNLITGFAIAVLIVCAVLLFLQHQAQEKLRADNEGLTQQLAQLKTDSESLSNRLATAGDSKQMPDAQFNELLKLRGEVGLLRNQVIEIGKLREENQQLRKEVKGTLQGQIQLPTQGQYEWHQTNTFNAAKLIELGMIMFAGANNDRFPTNFTQISNLTEGMTNQTSGIGTEAFEFLNAGCLANNQNANKIILREQTPFRTTDGKWTRTYGFGDGHAEVQISEDGNFDAFEQKHLVSPSPNQ
jgi:hypothetical protein